MSRVVVVVVVVEQEFLAMRIMNIITGTRGTFIFYHLHTICIVGDLVAVVVGFS